MVHFGRAPRVGSPGAITPPAAADVNPTREGPPLAPLAPPVSREADAARAVGNVASVDALPTTPIVAKYAGPRSGTQAAALLDKGFALDQAGQATRALALYEKAGPLVRQELADALGDRLTEKGMTPEEFVGLSAASEPMLVGFLARTGLFDELPRGLQETTLRYFNRLGLAHGHAGDQALATTYGQQAVELRSSYGLAHYNLACAALRLGSTSEALDHLERAVGADRAFFSSLALRDPDVNALRGDVRFRTLVGLPT